MAPLELPYNEVGGSYLELSKCAHIKAAIVN